MAESDGTIERLTAAFALIDRANADDPSTVPVDGQMVAAELAYSRRMSAWLARIEPSASEELQLAVRCQHLRRWEIPRASYAMTRAGYHQWRTRLGRFHAEKAAAILAAVGYSQSFIDRVGSLIRKERFKVDPEAQTLEDVACLVFIEMDYVDFSSRHDRQKVIEIIKKTWRKMSDRGHAAALELAASLPPAPRELIEAALGE